MSASPIVYETLTECPYCHGRGIVPVFSAPDRYSGKEGEFFLSKCQTCGLVFQNPRIPEHDIKNYYVDELGYYRTDIEKPNQGLKRDLYRFVKNATLTNHFGYPVGRRSWLLKIVTLPMRRVFHILGYPEHKKDGRLLEIGCSSGSFLAKLKTAGWNVEGIEFHGPSAEYAKCERGLEMKVGKVEEIELDAKRYDAVIMHMALEHLYTPFDTLKKITLSLKNDGQLIFSIPYFDGFEYKLFGRFSYGLHLPAHICFFNKKIIREFLTGLGYKDIVFFHHYFDRDIAASAFIKYKETGSRFYKILGTNRILRIVLIKPFVILLSLLKASSRVTVYARLK